MGMNQMSIHKTPLKLDYNTTNRCNFRCVHCGYDSGITEMDELSISELEKILMDSKDLGCKSLDIAGGEPLVREDLDEIIKLTKSLDYRVKVNTNGSLLTRKKLSYLKNLGLDAIAVSLDGSTYDVYSRIRKVNEKTYRRVLQTIDDSVDLGFYTKVNTVVFNSNLNDLPAIVELCVEKGVKENRMCHFSPIGRGYTANELSVEPVRWLNFVRKMLMEYDSEIKLFVGIPVIEKGSNKSEIDCIIKKDPNNLIISPDGNVYPCAILASYQKPVANLRKTSMKEVWNNQRLWKDYYRKVYSEVYQKNNGYCVDFSNFNLKEYESKKYKFVCPLRKFRVDELCL